MRRPCFSMGHALGGGGCWSRDSSSRTITNLFLAALKQRRTSPREVVVQSNTSVFLPCPVRSFHATYRWEKDNCVKNYPCLFSGDFCVLGPTFNTPLQEGVFRCMATEDGFKVEVISVRLVNDGRLLAASLASTLGPSLLLAAAALWLH